VALKIEIRIAAGQFVIGGHEAKRNNRVNRDQEEVSRRRA
jgi:hypothetical protein